MLYVRMITQIGYKVKKEIKHKKVNKSDFMSKKISNCVGLPYTLY